MRQRFEGRELVFELALAGMSLLGVAEKETESQLKAKFRQYLLYSIRKVLTETYYHFLEEKAGVRAMVEVQECAG